MSDFQIPQRARAMLQARPGDESGLLLGKLDYAREVGCITATERRELRVLHFLLRRVALDYRPR